MILSFHPCFTGDNQIILGARKLTAEELDGIQKAQAIILPQSCSAELYQACRRSPASLFPCFDVRFQYPGKVGQALLFERLNLRYPLTRIWSNVDEFQRSYRAPQVLPHALPFLLKTNQDHEGTGVFLIENQAMLKASLERLAGSAKTGSQPFISQDFIPAQGNVLRTIVLGQKIFSYWKRPLHERQLITGLSEGAGIDHLWRPDLQAKGRDATRSLILQSGINLAGVDFICDLDQADPAAYILEINYYFGRRGLGGSRSFYQLLDEAIREWLGGLGLDSGKVKPV
jgi:ribosomal protein S6--L-glutamate ligase